MSSIHRPGASSFKGLLLALAGALALAWPFVGNVPSARATDWTWNAIGGQWWDSWWVGGTPGFWLNYWGSTASLYDPLAWPGAGDNVTFTNGSSCTANQISNVANLNVNTGAQLIVIGTLNVGQTLTNSGSITVQSVLTAPAIINASIITVHRDNGVATLAANSILGGQIVLDSTNGFADLKNLNASPLTLAGSTTVRGFGRVYGPWTNNGLISADITNQTISLVDTNATSINNNLIQAINGGAIEVNTNLTNINGTLHANGGDITLNNGSITGGILKSSGSSKFNVTGPGGRLIEVTLTAGSTVRNVNGPLSLSGTLTNNGAILAEALGNSQTSSIVAHGNPTLAGTGSIQLIPNVGEARIITDDSGILINGPNHTIHGAGYLDLALINQGSILADDANGKRLTIQGPGVTNTGLLAATTNGLLDITTNIANANGTLFANGGTIYLRNSSVTGGTLKTSGSSFIYGYDQGARLTDVTLTAGSTLRNINCPLSLSGTLTNNGAILAEALGNSQTSSIVAHGNPTLAGTGSILLIPNVGEARIISDDGSILVNGPNHIIHGAGYLDLALTNQGSIVADANGKTLTIRGPGVTNTGLLSATNGAALDIFSNINNANGTLFANGGTIYLRNGTVTGGTLQTSGTSLIYGYDQGARLTDVTLAAGSTLRNINCSLSLSGTLTNNGTIIVEALGNSQTSSVVAHGNPTLAGNGSILLIPNDSVARIVRDDASILVNGPNHTIHGAGYLDLAITNQGTIMADTTGRALGIYGPGVVNNGLLAAANGAGLDIRTNINNANGTVDAGTLWVAFDRAPSQFSGSTLTGGTWIARASSSINIAGNPAITINQGTVVLEGAGSVFLPINSLTTNAGSFTIRNGRDFATPGSLTNTGQITVGAGSTLTVNGTLTSGPSGTATINGTLVTTGGMTVQGRLGGTGSLGAVTLAGGATLAPGNSVGTLTLASATLQDGAALAIELGSANPRAGASPADNNLNDRISVSGAMTFGPTSLIVNVDGGGLTFTPGNTYDYFIASAGSLGSLPATITVNPTNFLPTGFASPLNFSLAPNGNVLVLSFTPVPEPALTVTCVLGCAALAGWRHRRRSATPSQS